MVGSDVLVVVVAVVLTALLGWFFFAPRKAREAEMGEGVQVVRIKVQGGYSPDVVRVAQGVPVRMVFDRQEAGDCSSRVVMPDFKVNQSLAAWETTTVEFTPQAAGEFEFACGMNMLRGRVQVLEREGVPVGGGSVMVRDAAGDGTAAPPADRAGGGRPPTAPNLDGGDAEAAER